MDMGSWLPVMSLWMRLQKRRFAVAYGLAAARPCAEKCTLLKEYNYE
jgi:hypothetical protein